MKMYFCIRLLNFVFFFILFSVEFEFTCIVCTIICAYKYCVCFFFKLLRFDCLNVYDSHLSDSDSYV